VQAAQTSGSNSPAFNVQTGDHSPVTLFFGDTNAATKEDFLVLKRAIEKRQESSGLSFSKEFKEYVLVGVLGANKPVVATRDPLLQPDWNGIKTSDFPDHMEVFFPKIVYRTNNLATDMTVFLPKKVGAECNV
jgi:hypothetical protein